MIDPWKQHRARAVVAMIPKGLYQTYTVRLDNGHLVHGYDLPKRFKVGDAVVIRARFSITCDKYMIDTIRKAPVKRRHLKLVRA